MAAGEEAHQQHVNTPDEGAGQLQPVAGGHGEALADAEQEHADHGEAGAQPDTGAAALADQQTENRHHDHVEPGDEARVGHRGEQQADLLQVDAQRQRQAHDDAPQQQVAIQGCGGAFLAALQQHQYREQGQAGEGEAQAGIKEGADVIHAQSLGDEGAAPDHRGNQHQQVGAQGLASHRSFSAGKLRILPQSIELDHPVTARHAGRRRRSEWGVCRDG